MKKKTKKIEQAPTLSPEPTGYHRGFSSHNLIGQCELCWRNLKDHPICNACGALVGTQKHGQAPSSFREHTLCGSCLARWKGLDAIMRRAEGRDATWEEMLKGVHPSIVQRKEG